MKKVIVTTTINHPTEAIKKFDSLPDYDLVVIGDKKTPADYQLENGRYVSPSEQESLFPKLSSLIGWNCIQRRNIGFLIALEMGAEVVATIDDDNIPTDSWGRDVFVGDTLKIPCYTTEEVVFDPISVTNMPELWHRGFPIQLVSSRTASSGDRHHIDVKIQANFWDGDPDIDAICRMLFHPDSRFDSTYFPFFSRTIAPFNSQNTFLARDMMPNYFMFPFIGRMDDIWGAYYLQAITGERPVFARPTVRQDRNEHDLTKDFNGEVLGYSNTLTMLKDLASDPNSFFSYIPERSSEAFYEYRSLAEQIV